MNAELFSTLFCGAIVAVWAIAYTMNKKDRRINELEQALREKAATTDKIYREFVRLCYYAIGKAVRFRLQKQFNPMIMARRLTWWLHQSSWGENQDYNEIHPKTHEDEIAKDLAILSRLHFLLPNEARHDCKVTIEKLVAEKIKGNDVVERYVSAVTKRLFAEIAKEDPSTSQDNLEFFKNVKAIFPAFEWKEEDEMGFSVEE